jgi:uncharacterized membrane protein YkoI
MIRASIRRLLYVAIPVALGIGTATFAGNHDHGSEAREAAAIRRAVARGELVPLPRILALARQHVPGEVIKVELEEEKGTLLYEIKILTANGRVREAKLNARTAALISVEDD